jgi:hypothetical protein
VGSTRHLRAVKRVVLRYVGVFCNGVLRFLHLYPSLLQDVFVHEMPGGQYTNLLFQSQQLGLAGRWPAIKKAYAASNKLLGDIIKVSTMRFFCVSGIGCYNWTIVILRLGDTELEGSGRPGPVHGDQQLERSGRARQGQHSELPFVGCGILPGLPRHPSIRFPRTTEVQGRQRFVFHRFELRALILKCVSKFRQEAS